MAKKVETIVTLIDDMDGGKGDRTVAFAVEGISYEIDLSKRNVTAFESAGSLHRCGASGTESSAWPLKYQGRSSRARS